MKRLAALFFLLAASLASGATDARCGTTVGGFTVLCSDTTEGNLQNLVSGASSGQTVIIGGSDASAGPYTYSWTTPLIVTTNIKLKGRGMKSTKIQAGSGNPGNLIHYTCEKNNLLVTAELSDMELFGELGNPAKLWIDGVAIPTETSPGSGVWRGGLSMHDINFSTDPSIFGDPTAGANFGKPEVAGHFLVTQGFVLGVMYHCEVFANLTRTQKETAIINMESSPTDTGSMGDGAYVYDPLGTGQLAGTQYLLYYEDCLFHYGGGLMDSSSGFGGGTLWCGRHNTTFGNWAGHGVRTNGGRQHGTRVHEDYNNIEAFDQAIGQVSIGSPSTAREGEYVSYNNFNSSVGTVIPHLKVSWTSPGPGNAGISTDAFLEWDYGADGLNAWDKNQTGTFSQTIGPSAARVTYTYHTDDTYTFSGPQNKSFDPLNANDLARDSVTSGQDSDTRFGDVYAHANMAAEGGTINGTTLTGIKIHGPSTMANPIPTDYFKGFICRNATVPRSGATASSVGSSYGFITGNTAQDSNGHINITMAGPKPDISGGFLIFPNATNGITAPTNVEIRRVAQYYCQASGGLQDSSFNETLLSPARLSSGSPNPRWTNQQAAGYTIWGNRTHTSSSRTSGTPNTFTWGNEQWCSLIGTNGVGGIDETVYPTFKQFLGDPTTGATKVTQAMVDAVHLHHYPWNPDIDGSSATPATLVGADWTDTFPDGVTLGNNAAAFGCAVWQSFYSPGVGGFQYPHPLRGVSSLPTANSITVFGPTTVSGGTTAHYNIQDSSTAGANVTVQYNYSAQSGDNAIAGTDFTAPSPPAIIPSGSSGVSVDIPITSNPGNPDKQATLHLVSTAGDSSQLGNVINAVTTITNKVIATMTTSTNSVVEGNPITFTIHSNANVAVNTTFSYSVSGGAISGTDFNTLTGTATMNSGTNSVDIPVTTILRGGNQGTRVITLTITGGGLYTIGSPSQASTNITDSAVVASPTPASIITSPTSSP